MKVFILATVRKPELLPYTTLVFDTLRVGFPKSEIFVHFNRLKGEPADNLFQHCKKVQAKASAVDTIHHEWIENLVSTESEPFWICDTDIIFYKPFEDLKFNDAIAGFRIPEWKDDFSRAVTRARLHPSLLYINPLAVKTRIELFQSTLPEGPFTPFVNPFHPLCLPLKGRMYFYDTCSLLYHAIGGQAFTDEQKDGFCHMNFGTIPDLVFPRLPVPDATAIQKRSEEILKNHALGHGAWREQMAYYDSRRV